MRGAPTPPESPSDPAALLHRAFELQAARQIGSIAAAAQRFRVAPGDGLKDLLHEVRLLEIALSVVEPRMRLLPSPGFWSRWLGPRSLSARPCQAQTALLDSIKSVKVMSERVRQSCNASGSEGANFALDLLVETTALRSQLGPLVRRVAAAYRDLRSDALAPGDDIAREALRHAARAADLFRCRIESMEQVCDAADGLVQQSRQFNVQCAACTTLLADMSALDGVAAVVLGSSDGGAKDGPLPAHGLSYEKAAIWAECISTALEVLAAIQSKLAAAHENLHRTLAAVQQPALAG